MVIAGGQKDTRTMAAVSQEPAAGEDAGTYPLLWSKSLEKLRKNKKGKDGSDKLLRFDDAAYIAWKVIAWKRCLTTCKSFSSLKSNEAEALGFLSKGWIENALALPDSARVKRVEKQAIGEGLGFLSMTFRLSVSYEGGEVATDLPSRLILKVPGVYEQGFEAIAKETDCYRREEGFYRTVLPILGQYRCKMRVPKLYSSEVVQGGVRILMEDLGPLGYAVNQIDGLSFNQVKPFVVMAADLHAIFWDGRVEVPQCVAKATDSRTFIKRFNTSFVEKYDEFLATGGLEAFNVGIDKREILEIAAKIMESAGVILEWVSERAPQTLIHSDLRADNLIIGNAPGSSAVLDWQLLSTGPGVYDLGDLVVKSMTVEDNAMHLGDLLRLYHSTLLERGVRNYAYADLLRDFKFSILNHITLVFAIGVDGYDERRELIADWKCFALCRVMLRRLVRCILDFDCFSVLAQ